MNKKDKQEPDTQQSLIEVEDLTVNEDQAAELKGGQLSKLPTYSLVIDQRPTL